MKIITVSGAHSGVGKTMLVARLLKNLHGWSALKVTVAHDGACPLNKNCGACDKLRDKYCIIANKDIIEKEGKDTQRFKASGAKEVLWLMARPSGLKRGIREAIARFRNTKGIIIEGTSILKYLNPDLAIFVRNRDSVLKPSAKGVLGKMDLILTAHTRDNSCN